MKVIDVHLMPWKWDGVICVGDTSADFIAYVKKTFDITVTSGAPATGHAYVEYGKPWVLWVETLDDIPALAHEALHIAAGVLEARGLKHSDASEEAYTYTMEDILRQTLKKKAKWTRV